MGMRKKTAVTRIVLARLREIMSNIPDRVVVSEKQNSDSHAGSSATMTCFFLSRSVLWLSGPFFFFLTKSVVMHFAYFVFTCWSRCLLIFNINRFTNRQYQHFIVYANQHFYM